MILIALFPVNLFTLKGKTRFAENACGLQDFDKRCIVMKI